MSPAAIILVIIIHCVALCFAPLALLRKDDPRSALGWTAVLVFLPVAGLFLFLVFGISRAESHAERIMRKMAHLDKKHAIFSSCAKLPQDVGQEEKVMEALGSRLTTLCLCAGNSVQGLHNGDEAYPAMLEAIASAREHVFLSTYIFNAGEAAEKFVAALVAARVRGVDVRVIVDGCGALYSRKKPWEILAAKGVSVARFRPFKLFPPDFGINLRCHRKVLVCDDTGFTGGINIADGNVLALARKEGIPAIQDMQFRFQGPVVEQLRAAFLLNWAFCMHDDYRAPKPFKTERHGQCACRVVVDGPGNDADVLDDLISGAINIATRRVRIMTPYFLPSPQLLASLRSAALRGVDVRIALPAKNNLPFMTWATQRMLPPLLETGARVFMQPPPFAHTKLLGIDDFYCQVGSANLDARSMRLNFELNMEIHDQEFNGKLCDFIDSRLAAGKEITIDGLKARPCWKKLRDAACWLFSPYL